MPFASGDFDLVWMQNLGMHIPEKAACSRRSPACCARVAASRSKRYSPGRIYLLTTRRLGQQRRMRGSCPVSRNCTMHSPRLGSTRALDRRRRLPGCPPVPQPLSPLSQLIWG
jgi:hypothetical protein